MKNHPPKPIGFVYSPLWKIIVFGGRLFRGGRLFWQIRYTVCGCNRAFPWRVGGGTFCLRFSIRCAFCPCGLPLFQLGDFALYGETCCLSVRKKVSTQNFIDFFEQNENWFSEFFLSNSFNFVISFEWNIFTSMLLCQFFRDLFLIFWLNVVLWLDILQKKSWTQSDFFEFSGD